MRMWRVCSKAGRPWPRVSDDDVIDYLVMEAVAIRVLEEDRKAEKAAERESWKADREKLKAYA